MKFIWDSKYSVNIRTLDTQHQKYFEIINQLDYTIRTHQDDVAKISQILNEFLVYADFHLKYEEDIFTKIGYPESVTHCAAHDFYRQTITNFKKEITDQPELTTTIARKIADFARDWLAGHILAVDTKYQGYFLRHDIE